MYNNNDKNSAWNTIDFLSFNYQCPTVVHSHSIALKNDKRPRFCIKAPWICIQSPVYNTIFMFCAECKVTFLKIIIAATL